MQIKVYEVDDMERVQKAMDSDFQVKVVDFQAKQLELIQIQFKSLKLLLGGRSFVRLLIKSPRNIYRMSANLSELPP